VHKLHVNPQLNEAELGALFETAWPGHSTSGFDHITEHASIWITARRDDRLVGFVYVVSDGAAHAFLLDPVVHPDERRNGLGRRLVHEAASQARAQGAEWLHVDYEDHLEPFYRSCGFRPTLAGLLRLVPDGGSAE
jgi:GNAT superfamily N-acetyltransferase